MIKTPQLIISGFMGMLGIAMLIHFWGDFIASAIVSDVVGVVLIVVSLFTIVQYFRQRIKNKNENRQSF